MVVAVISQADYSSSYGNKRLSDVTLVIFEEPEPDQRGKRSASAVSEELPGHGVVLISSSEYCRTALENWTSSTSEGKYRLELSVPAGQLELGKLLVKGMYYSKLDLSDFTQHQLLQVLLLADRYEVPRFLAAVSAALESIPPAELQWDTAMAIYILPPGCADLEACKCLYKAAAAKVQQELGDLELVWDDQENKLKQQQLLDLPHPALKQLLQSPLTAVHSENTVCYTIKAWHEHQQKSKRQPSKQKMMELLELIRMQHCSQLYVHTVLTEMKFVQQCMSQEDLKLAALMASSYAEMFHKAEHSVLERYPAWTAGKRPVSECQQEILDWKVPLSQVQALVQQRLDDCDDDDSGDDDSDDDQDARIERPVHVWQGHKFRLELDCRRRCATADAAAGEWQLGAWLRMPELPAGAMCRLQAKVTAVSLSNAGDLVRYARKGPGVFAYTSSTHPAWGYKNFIGLGHIDSWGAALVGLRNKRLVHGPSGAAGGGSGEEFLRIMWQITDLE